MFTPNKIVTPKVVVTFKEVANSLQVLKSCFINEKNSSINKVSEKSYLFIYKVQNY